MQKLTALTITLLGLGALACAGGEEAEEEEVVEEVPAAEVDAKGAKLNMPWKEMNLPVGEGNVDVDTTDKLLLSWEGGDVTNLTKDFKAAILDAGWKLEEELVSGSQGDIYAAIIYKMDDRYVGLASGKDESWVFVYMEDLGKVSDEDSAVKNPDKRGDIAKDVRGRRGGSRSGSSSGDKGSRGSKGGKSGGGKSGKGRRGN